MCSSISDDGRQSWQDEAGSKRSSCSAMRSASNSSAGRGVRRAHSAWPTDRASCWPAQRAHRSRGGQRAPRLAATVGKWRSRFVARRLEGLNDEYRSGVPRSISDEVVEDVIVKTLEDMPKDATHWSTRSLANAVGISPASVQRIWGAFDLQPWRSESSKLSTDPLFIEKVKDVVGLYLDPPEHAVVLAVDEKSQIQALNRFQPVLPMVPGTPERRSHDYTRHGTTSLFAALSTLDGSVITSLHSATGPSSSRSSSSASTPRFPLVSTSTSSPITTPPTKTPAIKRWLARHPRFQLLRPDRLELAQPPRALVLRADDQEDQAWIASLGAPARTRHQGVGQDLEPQPAPLCLGQDGGPDLRIPRQILHTNF
jgi:homeodomain-containing protein